jgi:GLPGLI family protein
MKYKILIFSIFFGGMVSGQTYPRIYEPKYRAIDKYDSVDRGNLRVWYVFNPDDSQKTKTELCEDLQLLETGENLSKYYSYLVFRFDSISRNLLEEARKDHTSDVVRNAPWNKGACSYWSECFKNYSENSFTDYARMPRTIQNYVYAEPIPSFDWQLEEDTLTVAGYMCQKATCRFRGRDYISWFTADIPLDNGPWKFGGLPGLIMKIYDSDRKFVFECIGIEYKKFSITKYDYSDYQKSSREKILKLQKRIQTNYMQILFQKATLVGGTMLPPTRPYKPRYNTLLIELE